MPTVGFGRFPWQNHVDISPHLSRPLGDIASISSLSGFQVPLIFQKQMSAILEGLPGVLCHLDDVLVFGKDCQDHDAHLQAVLEQIRSAGITLNHQKCEFGKTTLTFLGHVINQHGISPDPLKTTAIKEMPPPKTVSELRRFMGMINQLGKFSPNIAEISVSCC